MSWGTERLLYHQAWSSSIGIRKKGGQWHRGQKAEERRGVKKRKDSVVRAHRPFPIRQTGTLKHSHTCSSLRRCWRGGGNDTRHVVTATAQVFRMRHSSFSTTLFQIIYPANYQCSAQYVKCCSSGGSLNLLWVAIIWGWIWAGVTMVVSNGGGIRRECEVRMKYHRN